MLWKSNEIKEAKLEVPVAIRRAARRALRKRALNSCGMTEGGTFEKGNSCAGTKGTGKGVPRREGRAELIKQARAIQDNDQVKIALKKRQESRQLFDLRTDAVNELRQAREHLKDKAESLEDFNGYTFGREEDYLELKDEINNKLYRFTDITDAEQVRLSGLLEEHFVAYKEIRKLEKEARGKVIQARNNFESDDRRYENQLIQGIQNDLESRGLNLHKDIYTHESDWDEYRILSAAKERYRKYQQEMGDAVPFRSIEEMRGMSKAEQDKFKLNLAFRSALQTAIDSEVAGINGELFDVRQRLDDGEQGRFKFDDSDRGQALERDMRTLWHKDRIENARMQYKELDESRRFMVAEGGYAKSLAKVSLATFDQMELHERYKKEYAAFKSSYKGNSEAYFPAPKDTHVDLENYSSLRYQDNAETPEHNAQLAADYFIENGLDVTVEDFAFLGGLGDDTSSVVSIGTGRDGDGSFAVMISNSDGYKADRILTVDYDGNVIVKNAWFKVQDSGKGLGSEIFARQVQAARSAGVKYLECEAVRGSSMNGYITWAKFGYDGEIPEDYQEDIEEFFGESIVTMQGLMKTTGGKEWWEEYGGTWHAKFDLDPDSYSSRRLDKYLDKKKMQKQSREVAKNAG